MKTHQFAIYLLLVSNLIGQITENDLKGEGVAVEHQSTSGPNDMILMIDRPDDQYHDYTLCIDKEIYLYKNNHTKLQLAPSGSQVDYDFKIKRIEKTEDINNYLYSTFMVRPIQLGLENGKESMIIISNSCEDEWLDKIYYFTEEIIGLHNLGLFFIFKRK